LASPEQPDAELLDRMSVDPLVRTNALPHAATRHMCVGCYVSHEFRERAMRDVYLERSRQVAPSYGFDLVPVLVHARRASWIDHAQHLIVIAAIIFWVHHDMFAAAITISAVVSWYVLKRFWRLFADYGAYLRHQGSLAERSHLRRRFRWLLAALIAPWIVVIGVAFYWARQVLDAHAAHPQHVAVEVARTILSLMAVVAGAAFVRQLCLGQLQSDPSRPRTYNGRIEQLRREQYRPITIFSGYRPFVGSGFEVRTWSFAQRLRRVGEVGEVPVGELDDNRVPRPIPSNLGEPPFRSTELIEFVKDSIGGLVVDQDPEVVLPTLRIYDKAFVGGFRSAKLTKDATPESIANGHNDERAIRELVANPTDPDRHYITCEVIGLNGELVATAFVHTGIQGRSLYLEFTSWAMPPTRINFQIIDLRRGSGLPAYITAIGRAVARMPTEVLRAPRGLLTLLSRPRYAFRPSFERARDGLRDVGAKFSLRELASNIRPDDKGQITDLPALSYFQRRDIIKYLQIIERRLLSTVMEFLENHDFDTTDYRDRAGSILNTGVLHMGSGNIQAQGAVGMPVNPAVLIALGVTSKAVTDDA